MIDNGTYEGHMGGCLSDCDIGTDDDEDCHMQLHEEARGCIVLDSGATLGVTSLAAADDTQEQRIKRNKREDMTMVPSHKRFKFGDGRGDACSGLISQPIDCGPLQGERVGLHLIDREGNMTPALAGMDFLRKHGLIVDFEAGLVQFKFSSDPQKWHRLPRSQKGLLMLPLTKEARDRWLADDE